MPIMPTMPISMMMMMMYDAYYIANYYAYDDHHQFV